MEYAPEYFAVGITTVAAILVIWDMFQAHRITSLFTKQTELIMSIYEEISAFIGETKQSLQNVSDDITRLVEKLENPAGLTAEEAVIVRDELAGIASNLSALAARTPEPPTEEPPVEG